MSKKDIQAMWTRSLWLQVPVAVLCAAGGFFLGGLNAGFSCLLANLAVMAAQAVLFWRVLSNEGRDPRQFLARLYSGEALKLILAAGGLAVVILVFAAPVFALTGFFAGVVAQFSALFAFKKEA